MPTQQDSTSEARSRGRTNESQQSSSMGERDEVYGVISVIYHSLQGAETYTQYVRDAQRAGDEELVEFFEECCEEEIRRAERGKQLLAMRLEEIDEDEDIEAGDEGDEE